MNSNYTKNKKNRKNIFKSLTLIFGMLVLSACSQDNRFPIVEDGWVRISDCDMQGEEDMIVQANESAGEAVIAYFDSEDAELYRETFTKDPDDFSDGESGYWYYLDGGDNDDDKVLIKTNTNATFVVGGQKSKPAPYRVWYWSSDYSYYCDTMEGL